ncbi:hypothetical protein M404DRAFT_634007 [Pisolithus tinctorius Marx 270]|uniref:Uncharacterized protein n=1 Tax=Pisolithus tinctorius Marx 270 TaxID=870435 RepID=A0A0C3J202_PISTI|nr:hypothetical protein M404DRAFT_634007 [Pisolithus tinctorius Marx 270]
MICQGQEQGFWSHYVQVESLENIPSVEKNINKCSMVTTPSKNIYLVLCSMTKKDCFASDITNTSESIQSFGPTGVSAYRGVPKKYCN